MSTYYVLETSLSILLLFHLRYRIHVKETAFLCLNIENWGTEKLSSFYKVTQFVRWNASIQSQLAWLQGSSSGAHVPFSPQNTLATVSGTLSRALLLLLTSKIRTLTTMCCWYCSSLALLCSDYYKGGLLPSCAYSSIPPTETSVHWLPFLSGLWLTYLISQLGENKLAVLCSEVLPQRHMLPFPGVRHK